MSRVRWYRVVAQDPSVVTHSGDILTALVPVPAEDLDEGPRGHRVAVVDYDASRRIFYEPWRPMPGQPPDAFVPNAEITDRPAFHARNAYALAMRTIARFEHALGRRVSFGFDGQELKIAPHAFCEANAYYSREHQALLFGYFPSRTREGSWVYTCLAHDVVVHETTHAILDGLRERYLELSHPDQAAFHEGFADIVALLSVFSMRDVVQAVLLDMKGVDTERRLIDRSLLTIASMGSSLLLGLAEQMGAELSGRRGEPLRRSALLSTEVDLTDPSLVEPHRRGEVLVAAMLHTFLAVWLSRLERSGDSKGPINVAQASEEAGEVADTLLTMAIKALDYSPPVDVRFGDFLSAILTSDAEVRLDDAKYGFREHLVHHFRRLRIYPAGTDDGLWSRPRSENLVYEGTHIESIQRSPEEASRFLWDNRGELRLAEDGYTNVLSVRPSLRIGTDGFPVRETVVEYKQVLMCLRADVETRLDLPPDMPTDFALRLNGGGVLIFDEYGRLKFHIHQRVLGSRQSERLATLWRLGYRDALGAIVRRLTLRELHAVRIQSRFTAEEW